MGEVVKSRIFILSQFATGRLVVTLMARKPYQLSPFLVSVLGCKIIVNRTILVVIIESCLIISQHNAAYTASYQQPILVLNLFYQASTNKVWGLVGKVGTAMMSSKAVGEPPTTVRTPSLAMVLDRQSPAAIADRPIQEGGSSFSLPSADVLGRLEGFKSSEFIDNQVRICYDYHEEIIV